MRLIKYGLLAFGLMLTAACEKPAEPAAETTQASAPAVEEAAPPATEEAIAPAAENMPAPADENVSASTPAPAPAATLPSTESATALATCPTGCYPMNCPPPTGPKACCKKTSTGYEQCIISAPQ